MHNIDIEVQASVLTPSQIPDRTKRYYKLGIFVLMLSNDDGTSLPIPDVDVVLLIPTSLEEIKNRMEQIKDGHVMVEL